MPFTGKATYSAGATLPEILEDVSDIIGIVSPYETPLLDHLGDPRRAAQSTVHEWIEDSLLPNTDKITQSSFANPSTATSVQVQNADRFRVGDQVKVEGAAEVMFVTAVAAPNITVTRGYGGTAAEALALNQKLIILGNAAIEGDDRPATRFTNRVRKVNYSQIFTASVEVSGSQLAARNIGIDDEMDFQKQERLRELLRDVENCVLNGVASAANPQGGSTTRRTMRGIIPSVTTNILQPGLGGIPAGSGGSSNGLTEDVLNAALRRIWDQSNGPIDTIVVNGFQKRKINSFIATSRAYESDEKVFRDMVSVYESDFGVCRVILSRWMPPDTVLLLDSSRADVMPLAGRNFHFKKLASAGDAEVGQVIGEYTLELRNENAHGVLKGLATS
jgi:hypothetical protein